jgi:hypothetical protein
MAFQRTETEDVSTPRSKERTLRLHRFHASAPRTLLTAPQSPVQVPGPRAVPDMWWTKKTQSTAHEARNAGGTF